MITTASLIALAVQAATAAPAAPDFATAQVAPGSWSYKTIPGGSEAAFVDATGTQRLVFHCTKATRRVSISRIHTAAAPTLYLWTSSASRTLPARFEPNAFRVTAELAANDGLLDAVAFSRGRIAASIAGASPLVVPAWPEAARAIEDCRT